MAAVLLDASKPDGLEQLELVSVLQLTCQELDGGGEGEARLPHPVCSRTIKSLLEINGRETRELVVAAGSHTPVVVVLNLLERQEMEGVKTCWEKAGEALLSHWYRNRPGSTSEQEPARSGRR